MRLFIIHYGQCAAFAKGVVEKMSGGHQIALAGWAKIYQERGMKDEDLRRQLEITFEPYGRKKRTRMGFSA